MATGKSGKISITGTKNMSAVLYWSETYDVATNTHVLKIDNIKFKSSNWYGFTYYLTVLVPSVLPVMLPLDHGGAE